jgi:hypothetical protein
MLLKLLLAFHKIHKGVFLFALLVPFTSQLPTKVSLHHIRYPASMQPDSGTILSGGAEKH